MLLKSLSIQNFHFLAGFALTLCLPLAMAESPAFAVRGSQLTGPDQQDRGEPDWLAKMSNWKRGPNGQHATWLAAMRAWRTEQRVKIGYDDAQYRRPDLL